MTNFLLFLLEVSAIYFVVFMFWSFLKETNKTLNTIIFCNVCYTWFSILVFLFYYYILTGIQPLPLAYLAGASVTGGAYKLFLNTDRLRKEKQEVEKNDFPYFPFQKELLYQARFFIFELLLFDVGLIFLNVFKLWSF